MPTILNESIENFSAESTNGTLSLSDFNGKTLVLYFYPKDSTPGCTTESENFRDHFAAFTLAGAVICGVSRDSLKSHSNFKNKLNLPFELISDPQEQLCSLFEVMKNKNMYGKQVRGIERSTFVIDKNGVLRQQWRSVKVPGHVEDVLKFVQSL